MARQMTRAGGALVWCSLLAVAGACGVTQLDRDGGVFRTDTFRLVVDGEPVDIEGVPDPERFEAGEVSWVVAYDNKARTPPAYPARFDLLITARDLAARRWYFHVNREDGAGKHPLPRAMQPRNALPWMGLMVSSPGGTISYVPRGDATLEVTDIGADGRVGLRADQLTLVEDCGDELVITDLEVDLRVLSSAFLPPPPEGPEIDQDLIEGDASFQLNELAFTDNSPYAVIDDSISPPLVSSLLVNWCERSKLDYLLIDFQVGMQPGSYSVTSSAASVIGMQEAATGMMPYFATAGRVELVELGARGDWVELIVSEPIHLRWVDINQNPPVPHDDETVVISSGRMRAIITTE